MLAALAVAGLAACGGSSSPSSSGQGSSHSPQSSGGAPVVAGDPFCTQSATFKTQIAHIGTGVTTTSTPTLDDYKALINSVDQALDGLDAAAPSAIASDFHTARAAYDQANTQVQAATSMQQIGQIFQGVGTPAIHTAATNISAWYQANCHF